MYLVILLFLGLAQVDVSTSYNSGSRKFELRFVGQCKEFMHLPLIFKDYVRNESLTDPTYNLTMDLKNTTITNLVIVFTLMKCDPSGSPDTCEYFMKDLKLRNVCDMLDVDDQAWSSFLVCVDKPLVCPIKPGVIHAIRCSLKATYMPYIPLGDAIWKVNMMGYNEGKLITCVNMENRITSVHVRKRN